MGASLLQTCQIKRLLSTCGAGGAGVCQYCGRPFCPQHGVVLEDGQEICSRKTCVAKREDVVRHLVYKQAALTRNAEQLCGRTGCSEGWVSQCSRCLGLFCELHVQSRDETVMENSSRYNRRVSLCDHCWGRRELWLRR